jgi:inosine-uridine nucleoside N-ribohydrolase
LEHTYHIALEQNLPTSVELFSNNPQAINTHFSNPNIPIAALRPLTNATFHDTWRFRLGEYASKVAHNFPRTLQHASSTPDPIPLYRSILANAPNASQTLISIGFLTNLAELLRSLPDAHSPLHGIELIEQKVAELVVMGGKYPSGWEYNFASNVSATRIVLTEWPASVPMTFSGSELGSRIFSGQRLPELAGRESPVLAAYQWYGDRCNTTRASYDPVTVLYAAGVESLFEFANVGGFNEIAEDGRNRWVEDGIDRGRRWLRLRKGVEETFVGDMLEYMYVGDPWEGACEMVQFDGGFVRVQS